MARRILCLVLILGVAAAAAAPTSAEVHMQVSPALLDLTLKPGSTRGQDLVVTNTGTEPLDATVKVDIVSSPEHSAVSWLTISPATIHIEGGQQQTIHVAIAVPKDLNTGGYYANVVITSAPPPGSGNRVAVVGSLGVGFMLTVKGAGKLVRSVDLEHFAPVLEMDGRVGFRADVKNTGNVHVYPAANVEIAQTGGKRLGSVDIPEALLLPSGDRLMQAQGSLPLPDGKYDATIKLSKDKGDKKPLTQKVTFDTKPDVALAQATVCENLDKGPTMTIGLENSGTIGVQPTISVGIQTEGGGPLGASTLPPTISWPGQTTKMSLDFSQRLESGKYVLVVEATYGAGQKLEQKTPFQIGGVGGNPVPLCTASATPAA